MVFLRNDPNAPNAADAKMSVAFVLFYLENWQSERTKGVQHITEAVVFLVSTPFIFFLRVWLSIASFFFYFQWFELMCFTYLFSLGSIRWQPFLNTATYDDNEHHWKLRPAEAGTMVFGIIAFCFLCLLTLLFNIMYFGDVYEIYDAFIVFNVLYYILILLVNPILFKQSDMTGEEYTAYQQRMTYAQQSYGNYGHPNFNQASYARPMNANSTYARPMQGYGQPNQPYMQQGTYVQQNQMPTQQPAQDTNNDFNPQ